MLRRPQPSHPVKGGRHFEKELDMQNQLSEDSNDEDDSYYGYSYGNTTDSSPNQSEIGLKNCHSVPFCAQCGKLSRDISKALTRTASDDMMSRRRVCEMLCTNCSNETGCVKNCMQTWLKTIAERQRISRRIMRATGKNPSDLLYNRDFYADDDKTVVQRLMAFTGHKCTFCEHRKRYIFEKELEMRDKSRDRASTSKTPTNLKIEENRTNVVNKRQHASSKSDATRKRVRIQQNTTHKEINLGTGQSFRKRQPF